MIRNITKQYKTNFHEASGVLTIAQQNGAFNKLIGVVLRKERTSNCVIINHTTEVKRAAEGRGAKRSRRRKDCIFILQQNLSGFQDNEGVIKMGKKQKERPPRPYETRPFTQDTVFFARLWYLGRCGGCKALSTMSIRQIAKLLHRSPQNIREAIGVEWLREEDRLCGEVKGKGKKCTSASE